MKEIIEEDFLLNSDSYKNITNTSLQDVLNNSASLKNGDLVIHLEYGLGRFIGIENIKYNNVENDFIKIEYADNASLLVPVENFDLITRYGSYYDNVKLDKLSKYNNWSTKKQRIKKDIKDLADKLINIAYLRQIKKAQIFSINAGSYDEFCNDFMFEATPDQIKVTNEITNDLSSGKLMDRLLCGDVGFGKTEVAIRASFVVVDNKFKGQVAVIVPTTLLCRQHYKQFCDRFKNTDYKIANLSRFTNITEAKKIKSDLETGNIDIIIGTHSLLNKSIKFKNLGLVIIDEEQRFGVMQKEKLKEIRVNTHVLSMSATPIPRTLQMSISGIKDLSLITTPPINRVNVETIVCKYDINYIKNIILNEIKRGGRVFFVVPRINDITEVENGLRTIMPELKYCVIHGKMNNDSIDGLMNDFYDGKYNLLIATTILESGIDVPIANTMIVYRADNFGLAQLYQLRGRVGRSGVQAYTYLTIKNTDKITDIAKKRLEIIESIKDLNSGFIISSEDMNMRGVGNILGKEQSGHMKDVGIELYNRMLKKAVTNKNNKIDIEDDIDFSPEIKINLSTIIPNTYINNIVEKMKYYREIADIENENQGNIIINKMYNKYGTLPDSILNLIKISIVKNKCKKMNIQKLSMNGNNIVIIFYNNKFLGVDKLIKYSLSNNDIVIKQDRIIFNYYNDDVFKNIENTLNLLNSCIV